MILARFRRSVVRQWILGDLCTSWAFLFLFVVLSSRTCLASVRLTGSMNPGFEGSQMSFIDNAGLFLLSNSSHFAFGFQPTQDVTLFLLVIVHMPTSSVVWTANRSSPVRKSDKFVFDKDGNVSLVTGGDKVWSPDTGGKTVSTIQMLDSGNLILLGDDDDGPLWQSFDNPADTILSGQNFKQGMKLSNGQNGSLSFFLEIISGDMILYANFSTPQTYWSMAKDSRKVINKGGGPITSATMEANSWKFYDRSKDYLWQFIFSTDTDPNITRAAVLGSDGTLSFYSLRSRGTKVLSAIKIPSARCTTPRSCDPYYACSSDKCQCPSGLISRGCKTGIDDPCGSSKDSSQLIYAGDSLSYFALEYNPPSIKTDLDGCKDACARNCSCLALFFVNGSGNCFLFDGIGSFRTDSSSSLAAYVKVLTDGGSRDGGSNMSFPIIITIAILTVLVFVGVVYGGCMYYLIKKKRKMVPPFPRESSEEDNFWEDLSGMPVRYSYEELRTATKNFSTKLGHGGFGSVYQGMLPNGTRIAVKKLEGIGQGKKEFRAEVSIIGSIHHVHLVRLRGFCAEGSHRLLAYDYMANGSLDKWIFKRSKDAHHLDWKTWYNIALGTAKGLAYLHEDCDAKIVHCDIKPENVLLDDQFQAKVSDFGLAKLMSREQSHVFTTLRGTRGYLAPEWITNYAISEKSDVYSYGMVLLEIIGGRKNYDPMQSSDKSHFPSYAFRMLEARKIEEIIDSNLRYDPSDGSVLTAVKVALWCIQEDMTLRPSMANVVQMLEGMWEVPDPPTSSFMMSRLFASLLRTPTSHEEGSVTETSFVPSDCNGHASLSAVQLSGPR